VDPTNHVDGANFWDTVITISNQTATQFSWQLGSTAHEFGAVVPARLLDSRVGGSTVDGQFEGIGVRAGGSVTELTVAGRGGVPADAAAVVLNVTVTATQVGGYLTIFPCGSAQPNASSLIFTAGQMIPNGVISKIGVGGKVCIFTSAGTDLIVDANGYFP